MAEKAKEKKKTCKYIIFPWSANMEIKKTLKCP